MTHRPHFSRLIIPFTIRLLTFVVSVVWGTLVLQAQVPDTSRAPLTDSIRVETGGEEQSPVRFRDPEPGEVVSPTPPILLPVLNVTSILEEVPGSFVYEFGTPGWPDAWSPRGLDPARVELALNGIPFDDPVTGSPAYELLPLEFLEPVRVQDTRYGAPIAVVTEVRSYDDPRPATELRYRKGDNGLQAIAATHSQLRRPSLFGRTATLGILGGYMGRAVQGEYPGSRLRRERKLLARIRYELNNWSFELLELYNRREIGAHGGVTPRTPGVFESIYRRIDARVYNPEANRLARRNDLALTVRTRLVPGLSRPIGITAYWTTYSLHYSAAAEDLTGSHRRLGLHLWQQLSRGSHALRVRVDTWMDHLDLERSDSLLTSFSRRRFHAALHDSIRFMGSDVELHAGYHAGGEKAFPSAGLNIRKPLGVFSTFLSMSVAGQPERWIEDVGFDAYIQPQAPGAGGRVLEGRAGLSFPLGTFDFTTSGFYQLVQDPVDLFALDREAGTFQSPDTVQVIVAETPFRRAGVMLEAGWRRTSERGLYARGQVTFLRFLNEDASELHVRVSSTLPELFGQARAGARFILFRGDLDIDAYLQGRYWSQMRSRLFHPPTGLLVVPELSDFILGSSGILDLVVEAGIRTATIFLGYENFLSGTDLMPGNLIVPVYPLAESRFRFGVYWPIFN